MSGRDARDGLLDYRGLDPGVFNPFALLGILLFLNC